MFNIQDFLQETQTDAFLISNFFNIFYTTGFETLSKTEREAYALITKEKLTIITDSRYERGDISNTIEFAFIEQGESSVDVLGRLCKFSSITSLGYEGDSLTWNEVQSLQQLGVTLTPFSKAFALLRSIKREEELFAIKQACHMGDMVLKDITPYLHPTQTEKEIAWIVEKLIREAYNAELAFDPIVAVDAHAAIPHYNTKKGEGIVKDGSLLLIDFGVKAHNYCSDITRMVGFGNVTDEIKKIYSHLLNAQKKTIDYAKNASELKDIDTYCCTELERHSLPRYSHSTGHGLGLEIHESPRISAASRDEMKVGNVFTIEPGVYLPGKWGMRIEDTIAVLDQMEIEVLTRFPKDLILL